MEDSSLHSSTSNQKIPTSLLVSPSFPSLRLRPIVIFFIASLSPSFIFTNHLFISILILILIYPHTHITYTYIYTYTEALCIIAQMCIHKNFATQFVDKGGIKLLLDIPREPFFASVIAHALYRLASHSAVLEKICLVLPQHIYDIYTICILF